MTVARRRTARLRDTPVALGLITLLAAVLLLTMAWTRIVSKVTAPDTTTVTAIFDNTRGLRSGDAVRIDGVNVGHVETVRLTRNGIGTAVEMAVEDSAGPVYANARAELAQRTLLGASFVVNLQPGAPQAGRLGSRAIAQTSTSGQAELEDVTTITSGAAGRGLQTVPGEVSRALRERELPARTLEALTDASPSLARGLDAVRGRQGSTDLRRIVVAAARTAQGFDAPTDELRRVVASAAATLATTAGRGSELRDFLAQAPPVLQRTNLTLRRLDTTLGLADPLVARLQRPAGRIAPTVAKLRPVVARADRLARAAVPLLRSLRPSMAALGSAAGRGRPLLDGLAPSLERLDDKIIPILAERDVGTKHTTSEMIGPGLTGIGAFLAPLDHEAHFVRFPLSVGEGSFTSLPCRTFLSHPDEQAIARCDSLKSALSTVLNYRPMSPVPGTAPQSPGGARP